MSFVLIVKALDGKTLASLDEQEVKHDEDRLKLEAMLESHNEEIERIKTELKAKHPKGTFVMFSVVKD